MAAAVPPPRNSLRLWRGGRPCSLSRPLRAQFVGLTSHVRVVCHPLFFPLLRCCFRFHNLRIPTSLCTLSSLNSEYIFLVGGFNVEFIIS